MPVGLGEVELNDIEKFLTERCKAELNLIGEHYPKKQSILIDFQELSEFSPNLGEELIENPDIVLAEFNKALQKIQHYVPFSKPTPDPRLVVRIRNLPSEQEIFVRECTSQYLNKFFIVQGLVTKVVDTLPRVWKGVFRCKRCNDKVVAIQDKKTITSPGVCNHCGRREFELVLEDSRFIDFQKMEVQEPLEILKGGDQAKRISVWLEDDLTNKVLPGQRIIISGSLKLEAPKGNLTVYQKFIEANNIEFTEQEFEELEITDEDIEEIKKIGSDPKIMDKVISSIAPSIYGHNEVKEAIALQLCGATSHKKLPDGTKIRDNIHILLIGDPGTAKSQILKYVDRLAPKSIYVSGKSATGGGLTAIAEKDEFGEGGWVLKAGALVLSSGGLACIDEFDKMSEEDRSAIHEALEQQTVSVAKAGIIATFRANSAVLAAANPKYSRFDPYKPPAEQFDIPPTLISRFDLIFPVKDVLDEARDKDLASHILNAHRLAHGGHKGDDLEDIRKKLAAPIEESMLKKYVAYVRRFVRPILSDEAVVRLQDYYVDLRKRAAGGSVPLTARQLEGLVRLSESSAKLRLSERAELEDAERAIRLVEFVLSEIGMDSGGGFDIDRIMAEHPKSERDRIYIITKIVKDLEEQYDLVPKQMVLDHAKEYNNIEERDAEKLIHELVGKGDLYEPKHDHLKTVSSKTSR